MLNSLAISPDMSFLWKNVRSFMFDGLILLKKSSNKMWNYGENNPVCRIRIKSTDDACLGEGPRLIPSLSLDSNLV